jgi:hypothetical protein
MSVTIVSLSRCLPHPEDVRVHGNLVVLISMDDDCGNNITFLEYYFHPCEILSEEHEAEIILSHE